jgi:rhodanese-related sulfurtransferase
MKHNPGFLSLVEQAKQRVTECSAAEVKAKLDRGEKFRLIDVREDREYEKDHAKGAVHIGKGVIERDIETLVPNKDEQIILYCGGGFRSALAADSLQRMGYHRVVSMDGGIRAWRESGYPMEP